MFCMQCGTQLPDNMRFCTNCGQPVTPVMQSRSPAQGYVCRVRERTPFDISAPRIGGEIPAGEIGALAEAAAAKSKVSLASILAGLGVSCGAFAVLWNVPHKGIVSAIVGGISLIRIIYVRLRGGRKR